MANKIRWGIISTGNIATSFAEGLQVVEDAELVAVGSRSQNSADAFGEKFNIPNLHDSYEALVNDPNVDAVYIGTPHPFHKDNALLCLEAGKAVLCEKPFTVNADDANVVIEAAKTKGLFLMEALWSRFLPAIVKMKALIADGAIGEVRMVQADFGFRAPLDPEHRLFAPELAGGALLDVGVYPINMAWMVLGAPADIQTTVHIGQTGVDEQVGMLFHYAGGPIAVLSCATRTETQKEAIISGTEGVIRVDANWWQADKITLIKGEDTQVFEFPFDANGYEYEAREVGRCLRAGLTESPHMTHAETLAIMQTMDAIRAQWGLTYPME